MQCVVAWDLSNVKVNTNSTVTETREVEIVQLFQPKGHHNRSTNSTTFANFQYKGQNKQKYKQHNYCLETSMRTKSKVQFCTNMEVSSSSMSQQELLDFLMYLKQDMRPSVSSELLEELGHIESLSTLAEGETCRYMTDTTAANLSPEDADRSLGPVRAYGDGNCLYRSASLLVCGNESRHLELHLRTAIELCKNVQHYAYAVVQHARSCLESLSPVAVLSSTLKTS